MRKQRHPEDDLPTPLREGVEWLKQDDRPLPAEVEARLAEARQAALTQFAQSSQSGHAWADALSWASFGHPRMAGMAALSVFFAVGLFVLSASHNDDAMLLSDDLPVEAFVDSGFDAWQYSENI
ncbi:MAG TPA: DUF3619 domain-containing protein [Methylophilus sp.]|nr:DUF3619 domain-containing protein [Methylophilus sp.]